ncbi:MAG: hypothetical protein K8S55_06445, partial [Phycisphaerae bacterium]|nr:hypothetical protein [Phycisphaerae bacterium]
MSTLRIFTITAASILLATVILSDADAAPRYKPADRNKDGNVDRKEYRQAKKRVQRKRKEQAKV